MLTDGSPPEATNGWFADGKRERTGPRTPPGISFILERTLTEAQKAGVARLDMPARDLTLAAWAIVHGIASLLVSGRLPDKEAAVTHYLDLIGTLFFEGAGKQAASGA